MQRALIILFVFTVLISGIQLDAASQSDVRSILDPGGEEGYARTINDKTYYYDSSGREIGTSRQVGDQQVLYGPSGQVRGTARVGEDGRTRFYGKQGGQANAIMEPSQYRGDTAIGAGNPEESGSRADAEAARDSENAAWFSPGSSFQGFYASPEGNEAKKE